MSYNDGWRVYENIPVNIEKLNMLNAHKLILQRQITKQMEKVSKVSQEVQKITYGNISKARRVKANMRLQCVCSARDDIDRRINIIDDWINCLIEGVADERTNC